MHFTALLPLADRGSLYAYLRQISLIEALDEELGAHTWELDLPARRLTFHAAQGTGSTSLRVHLVARVHRRSLRWGWAYPEPVDAVSRSLREYGRRHGIEDLIDEQPILPSVATGEQLQFELALSAHRVANAAVAITGVGPYYCLPQADGSIAVALVTSGLPELPLTEATLAKIGPALNSASIVDQRLALHGLAQLSGWTMTWDRDWTEATCTDPATATTMRATFDDAARLRHLGVLHAA